MTRAELKLEEIQKLSGLQAYYDQQQSDIEKFAELIVKECAEMAGNLSPHRDLAISAIKEHFGVE